MPEVMREETEEGAGNDPDTRVEETLQIGAAEIPGHARDQARRDRRSGASTVPGWATSRGSVDSRKSG